MVFIVTADNINSFRLRNVCIKRTNVKCGLHYIVWSLRVFDKVNKIGSVFKIYDSCLVAIGCKSESTKLEIRSVGLLLPETIGLPTGVFFCEF